VGGLSALTDLIRSRPAPAAAAAGGWTLRTTTLPRLYPDLAINSRLVPAAAAYAFGAYAQLSAAAAADYLPYAAHLGLEATISAPLAAPHIFEIEIATGAAGQEVLHSRLVAALAFNLAVSDVILNISTGLTLPLGVTQIPSGTRIAARCRASNANPPAASDVGIYLAGFDAPSPDSDLTYPLDAHLDNADTSQSLIAPWGSVNTLTSAAYPTYGTWQQVIAPAPSDLLVHGVTYGIQVAAGINGFHLQFGLGAAGSEVPYALLGLPDHAIPVGCGTQLLRRPLLVLAGEDLSVRGACNAVRTLDYQVLYEQI